MVRWQHAAPTGTTAIVWVVTEGGDPSDLNELYEELKRFAPSQTASEMARLGQRLQELEQKRSGGGSDGPLSLDDIWERVEDYLDQNPQPTRDASAEEAPAPDRDD